MAAETAVRVLVADDQPHVLEALGELLGSTPGVEVVATATSAPTAVAASARHRPDTVVLDVRMPGGGLNAVREIRAALPDTQVVVLSAHDTPELRRDATAAGAGNYLVKGRGEDLVGAILRGASRLSAVTEGGARS
jgi:DNA-binding NarL/FixJ family response regulator